MCTIDLDSIYVERADTVTVHKARDVDLDILGIDRGEDCPSSRCHQVQRPHLCPASL